MSKSQVKATVDRLFTALAKQAESSSDNSRYLDRAYQAALESEKAHRRMGAGLGGAPYRQTPQTAARYFVCKWYNDPGKIGSALDAANLRDDCLYASALRLSMPGVDVSDIASIDYSRDFAGDA